VTTYTRPAALYASLLKDTSQAVEFTLSYRDQAKDRFDIAGSVALLAAQRDRFGNGYDIAYEGASTRINILTENGANRVVDFTWDGTGHLGSITDWAWADAAGVVQQTASGARRVHRFFYDGEGRLTGWADPLNTTGGCPSGGSHITCLSYGSGQLQVSKTQTRTTLSGSPAVLGTATRLATTEVAFAGSGVTSVRDAEQQALGGASTTFTWDTATRLRVTRPGTPATTTTYGLVTAGDAHGRVQSVWRRYTEAEPDVEIEQRTVWDATFPTEPASVTDNYGALLSTPERTISYTYEPGSLGNLTKLVEPLTSSTNRWTQHTYNANNDVTRTIVSQDGSTTLNTVTRYCYSADCSLSGSGLTLLKRIENYVSGGATDEDTNVATEFAYDASGQLIRETRHNRSSSGAVLDDRVDALTYDSSGDLVSEIVNYVDGQVSAGGSDVDPGAGLARTDLTTTHGYDTAGNRTSTASPRRAILAATGTPAADDYVTRWTYDALNQQVTERTPTTPGVSSARKTSSTAYDEGGSVRAATDFGGLVTATEYDRAGRPVKEYEDAPTTPAEVTGSTSYDDSGRVTSAMDREQVSPGATRGSTASTYDSLGRVVSETEAASSTPDVASITELRYDALDRVTVLEVGAGSPASMRTDYSYDRAGRETKADDGFACRTVGYDYRDLPVSLTEGLVGGTCAAGSDTVEITQTHDGLARMTRSEIVGPAGRPDIGDRTLDDTLDAAGNIRSSSTREAGVASTDSFVLNVVDEVVVETRQDGSTAKSRYDADGNETDRCFWQQGAAVGECLSVGTSPWPNAPTRSTTSAYDALMQRISLIDGSVRSTTTYDPDHNYAMKASYLPTADGREQQALYAYDERHRLASITHQLCTISSGHSCSAVTALGSATYEYDDNDNVTRVVESNGAATSDYRYCYDARNQLTYRNTSAACSASSNDQSMSYDDAGNRLSYNARTFTYDSKGRLEACQNGSCGTVAHDTDGRISQLGSWYFHYDAEGRLVRACKASGCPSTADKVWFTYDAEGRRTRVKSRTGGGVVVITDFAYQTRSIVEERLTDDTHTDAVVRRYLVDEAGSVVKMEIPSPEPNAGMYSVNWNGHGDAQGLWRLNEDGTTTLANSFTYDTWGTPTTSSHNGIGDLSFRFLYAGRFGVQWDHTFGLALLYMSARHYKPSLGRFLQPDPMAAERNWYAYASNNPVSMVDPQGTCGIGGLLALRLRGVGLGVFACLARLAGYGGRASTWTTTAGRALVLRVQAYWNPYARLLRSRGLYFDRHAYWRMAQRRLDFHDVARAVVYGNRIVYNYHGRLHSGYYHSGTRLFVATWRGQITTVFRTGPRYIRNLRPGLL
jgi:RHS repeat-associated protein